MTQVVWLAVTKYGDEMVFSDKPERKIAVWLPLKGTDYLYLPDKTIENYLGYKLTWDDEPVMMEN